MANIRTVTSALSSSASASLAVVDDGMSVISGYLRRKRMEQGIRDQYHEKEFGARAESEALTSIADSVREIGEYSDKSANHLKAMVVSAKVVAGESVSLAQMIVDNAAESESKQ
jgi:hypothetical protein